MVKDDVKKIDQGKKGKERKFQLYLLFLSVFMMCVQVQARVLWHTCGG